MASVSDPVRASSDFEPMQDHEGVEAYDTDEEPSNEINETDETNETNETNFETYLENLSAELLRLKSQFSVSGSAVNEVLKIMKDYFMESLEIHQRHMENDLKLIVDPSLHNDIQRGIKNSYQKNFLYKVLSEGLLETVQKRKTLFQKQFSFVPIKQVLLGHNSAGQKRYVSYCDPKTLLQRMLSDETVFQQYKKSKEFTKFEAGFYSDYFSSQAYKDLLATIPTSEQANPPLLLGLYRFHFSVSCFFEFQLKISLFQ